MSTNAPTIVSLTNDHARWNDPLVSHHGWSASNTARAEREVAVTMSAIVGDSRPIVTRHNSVGRWAVMIDESTSRQITVMWSTQTANENPVAAFDRLRPILRGEAVMVMIHEMGHVLFTTEIERPDWCDPAHWREFFMVVNFAEDVRIEDCMEREVPAFAMLRKAENDRMVAPNVSQWGNVGMVRRVCSYLFAKRSCTNGAAEYAPVVNATEQAVIAACHDAFMEACDKPDTGSLIDTLEPMYDALLPYMDGTIQYPPPTTRPTGGTGDEDEDEDGEDEGGSGKGTTDDEDEADDGTSGDATGDGESDEDEADGGASDEDADEDDTEDDSEGDNNGTTNEYGGDPGGDGAGGDESSNLPDKVRPDRERGKWDEDRDETPLPKADRTSEVIEGNFITTRQSTPTYVDDKRASVRLSSVTRLVTKNLRRVLQDNANGGWIGRKRRGAFDAASAKRLALGDLRAFRERTGPKGSLDYSLVVCIDASGSMRGHDGYAAADAALAVYNASDKVDGLDVAVCAYGCTVDFGIPFRSTLTKAEIRKIDNAMSRALRSVRYGASGGTNEADALVWARAVSRKRRADTQMIIVVTDGYPNSPDEASDQVTAALREGVVTGGIGIGDVDPDYHTYATSIGSSNQLPKVLGDFIRTMMKGGK